MNGVRSYANSYLYTKIPDYERNILEYIMKAERIDKSSEAFYGVVEDVKRRQTSAVLSRVLARDDVVLCMYTKPLPASFKVFACKDVKTDRSVRVFIDLTGLITNKNGFYVINKIDVFCSYLLSAMTTLIYNNESMKVLNNSSVIQSGTECFVNLSSHIFDYMRANGYAENKNKIAYILAMYFQCTIMGLDRNSTSVKALAAKLADINSKDINAMEIYYKDEDLVNIHTLITAITDVFKMKGVGTDTFIEKWTWFYGVGTQFATELFTAFSSMITDAYCGAYVNNQKTIEKCCGRAMVNFTNAILRLGSDLIDQGFRYESTIEREANDRHKTVIQEGISVAIVRKTNKITTKDLQDLSSLKKKIKILSIQGGYGKSEFSGFCLDLGTKGINIIKEGSYKPFLSGLIKEIKPHLNKKDKEVLIDKFVKNINSCRKNNKKVVYLDDMRKALKELDPKNPVIKESTILSEISVVDKLVLRRNLIKKEDLKLGPSGLKKRYNDLRKQYEDPYEKSELAYDTIMEVWKNLSGSMGLFEADKYWLSSTVDIVKKDLTDSKKQNMRNFLESQRVQYILMSHGSYTTKAFDKDYVDVFEEDINKAIKALS